MAGTVIYTKCHMTHGLATVSVRLCYGEIRLTLITYAILCCLTMLYCTVRYDQDIDTIRNVLSTFCYVFPGSYNDESIKIVF